MKRIQSLALFLTLICSSLSSYAGILTTACPLEVRLPCFNTRYIFAFTGLYQKAYVPEDDYVLDYSNTFFVAGRFNNNQTDFNWGLIATFGYVFPCSSNDVQADYIYFLTEQKDVTRRHHEFDFPTLTKDDFVATIDVSPLFLPLFPGATFAPIDGSPIIISPDGVISVVFNGSDLVFAVANSKFRQTVADVDFGQYVDIDVALRVRGFLGVRYAYLKNNLDARYRFFHAEVGDFAVVVDDMVAETVTAAVASDLEEIVNQRTSYNGLGPRLGFDANLFLGNGFGLFGSLSSALLIGDITTKLLDIARFNTTFVVLSGEPMSTTASMATQVDTIAFPSRPRIVPNLQGEVGIDYSYIWSSAVQSTITLAIGWQFDHYFNAFDRLSGIDINSPELRTRRAMDVDFSGPFARIEVRI